MISFRRQLGYLYLSTGANGAGKTLFTIADVRELQMKTNRPVYFKGFTALQPLLDFGWIEHPDMTDWQSLPDGSICIWDECQEDIKSQMAKGATDWEQKILSVHRKRGFDFFFITQHPMNMGAFIRRAIAAPGWHRHYKASSITLTSAECKWATVNSQAEKPNSSASGTVVNRAHPQEVYSWYKSSVGDTAQRKIPAKVWLAVAAVIGAIGMLYGAYWWFNKSIAKADAPQSSKTAPQQAASAPVSPVNGRPANDEKRVLTPVEYAQSLVPRIDGLAFTAPRYDALNTPKAAPRPAVCIDGKRPGARAASCSCWTQQANLLQVPEYLCKQIAAHGYFDDTLEPQGVRLASPTLPPAPVASAGPSGAYATAAPLLPPPETRSTVERDASVMAFMAKRREFK